MSSTPPIASFGEVITIDFFEHARFVVGKELSGGMGKVLQLVPVRPGRTLALKTIQAQANPAAFERECRFWLSLVEHPNIAHALAFGRWRGRPSILVEWYDAELSYARVRTWTAESIQQLLVGLVGALEYALTRRDVLHLDIKPSNVLLDGKGQARLTDFGIARLARSSCNALPSLADVDRSMSSTMSVGGVAGTLLYMAPELFGGSHPSLSTEMFSLGVTLYEVLTGTHPFIGPETAGKWRPNLREAPLAAISDRLGPKAEAMVKAIRRCVSLDPIGRPRSYAEVLQLLGVATRPSTQPSREQQIHGIIASARAFREQGRFEQAATVLDGALVENPRDPLLLNARGVLHKTQGDVICAASMFARAADEVRRTGGTAYEYVYLDPMVNLSVVQYDNRDFAAAHHTLREVWCWLQTPDNEHMRAFYPEFGWMFLYEGKFVEASDYLMEHLRGRSPRWLVLQWLVLAASLSGELGTYAPRLAPIMQLAPPASAGDMLCITLAAVQLPESERKRMQPTLDPALAASVVHLETMIGVPRGDLALLRLHGAQLSALQALDFVLTGGIHARLFR